MGPASNGISPSSIRAKTAIIDNDSEYNINICSVLPLDLQRHICAIYGISLVDDANGNLQQILSDVSLCIRFESAVCKTTHIGCWLIQCESNHCQKIYVSPRLLYSLFCATIGIHYRENVVKYRYLEAPHTSLQ